MLNLSTIFSTGHIKSKIAAFHTFRFLLQELKHFIGSEVLIPNIVIKRILLYLVFKPIQ